MESIRKILENRLEEVEGRIAAACTRAGRPREAVTLVAVTKTVSLDTAREILTLGVTNLGENRPQELWKKQAALPEAHWHMIGHLQRNKVEQTAPLVVRIHAVDSLRLLQALEENAQTRGVEQAILLEVNASQEESKQGFAPALVPELVPVLNRLQAVRVCGLMTMAAYTEDPESTRPTFVTLRALLDKLARECDRRRHPLNELSMGMSNDYEVAIEEGATWIRLGTVLFEDLP